MRTMALDLASATKNSEIGAMSVRKMKFMPVNDIAPRGPQSARRVRDRWDRATCMILSTSRRYCGIACYPRWMVMSEFVGSFAPTDLFELAVTWPKLDTYASKPEQSWG
jgi:hypothetical protein